jgi:hypothetical protein
MKTKYFRHKIKEIMNKYFCIVMILLIPVFVFGQANRFKSKERDRYYKKYHYKDFTPVNTVEILNYRNDFFHIEDIAIYSPYSEMLFFTPYQDSLHKQMIKAAKADSDFNPEFQYIGKIEKYFILKYEKKGQIEAFIYESREFGGDFSEEPGVWVALSVNYGKSWKYYYTGIVQKQPLFVKWYSKVPLIRSDTALQIETCLLRQLTPFTLPSPTQTYEVVKDGLLLTLDFKTLRRDTDLDGLTDIVETKFHTNVNNKDSDGDGISDNVDLNPRFSVPGTDKTVVYEYILNQQTGKYDTTEFAAFSTEKPQINYATDSTETILIISDSPDIQSIQPKAVRVIILSETEYANTRGSYSTDLKKMSFSPLFKVDGEKDTYILDFSFQNGGDEYLIRKTKTGWKISIISTWIS